jgi:hypothetical protein
MATSCKSNAAAACPQLAKRSNAQSELAYRVKLAAFECSFATRIGSTSTGMGRRLAE